uniref:C-type lectin domain-containing protein n=1 Tax=Poecilia mexicana TaxID=48701 RepID=A0A3B3X957_9TELE
SVDFKPFLLDFNVVLFFSQSDCISLGANLASIHSSGEHIFLKELVNSKKGSYQRTWVGGHDAVKEGVWMWSDGSKFDYTKWGSGEPNNVAGNEHCMEINIAGEHDQSASGLLNMSLKR